MPASIDTQVKKQVIKQYLSGDSRDRIAADNGIGAGTVSNIINELKKGIENSDYDSVRELAVYSKKEGFGLSRIASSIRLNNYIQKLGADEDQIESFIANLVNSPEPAKLIDVANQVAHLSRSESIPLHNIQTYIEEKEAEKQRLEEEIKHSRAIVESTNLDVQIINEYKQLKAELGRHRLSTEDPTRLLSILRAIKQIGYDPRKIVARFSQLESLRQTERGLIDNCRVLEEPVGRCREVLPLCEQIVRLRIGIGELLAFHSAVCERAEKNNLSRDSAAYLVIEDIHEYNRLGGMKKQQSDVAMQIYALNQFSGRQNNAIMALMRLQTYGITDDEILNMHDILNRARSENTARIQPSMS